MLVSSLLLCFVAQVTEKPDEIWQKVEQSYAQIQKYSAEFRSVAVVKNRLVYTGGISFQRNGDVSFEIKDYFEKCTAGMSINAKNEGSSWVSPADMRGYNDSLAERPPYLIVSLLREESLFEFFRNLQWNPEVQLLTEGKKKAYRLSSKNKFVFIIDAQSYELIRFVSRISYIESGLAITYIKRKSNG